MKSIRIITKVKKAAAISTIVAFAACTSEQPTQTRIEVLQQEVPSYLNEYSNQYQQLYKASAEAAWALNTKIVEGDTVTSKLATEADEAFAAFTGNSNNIETVRTYLTKKDSLTSLQVKQLETILYAAGANPEVAKDIVKKKIQADTEQTEKLFGFDFKIDGKSVTPNQIDKILKESTNLKEREKAWNASKEVGKTLKDGLANLQTLRNQSVQALGYSDYFNYQVSEYGMTTDEMLEVCRNMNKEVWPLYRELHTWMRYTLAEKYKQPVPDLLPAHWITNRWGQEWSDVVEVEGLNLDDVLKEKSAEWIIKEGEKFYVSLGFPNLPASFYEKSSLYPLPDSVSYKKNNHASAWHLDLDTDVRSLMSIEPNTNWWETTLHELGHIYYYMTYSNPDVPLILRGGANRGFHEAMGSQMGLASLQKPFLTGLNLLPADSKTDETQIMLKEALNYIVLIPWGAGVMTEFEHELYSNNLPKDQYNAKWWELKKKYQGIVPPTERGEEYCDAASKTHINNDPAQYYDYAISNVLLFQLHIYIANNILKQDPHATNYYGNKEVGDFIKKVMYPGASVDWRTHLKNSIGEEMSAKPMVNYFAPLMAYLQEVNKGRKYTLPETL